MPFLLNSMFSNKTCFLGKEVYIDVYIYAYMGYLKAEKCKDTVLDSESNTSFYSHWWKCLRDIDIDDKELNKILTK